MRLYPISKFIRDSPELLVGFIDANGTAKVTPRFAGAGHFSEGKAAVVGTDGCSGFIGLSGDLAIRLSFRGVSHFHDGVCSIGAEHGVGYIDHLGAWVIEPRFLIAMDFSEGSSFVSEDGESFRTIDMKGKRRSATCFERARPFRSGLAPVMKEGVWGFIDGQGATAIPFMFEDTKAEHFKHGLAAVKLSGKWGFIDRSGEFSIKPYFEDLRPFAEGLAPVRLGGKWGMLDLGGEIRLKTKWDELGQLVNGLAPARINGKSGYIDATGEWAIEPAYDTAKPFFGDLALVYTGDTPAYVRADGKIVWQFEPHAIVPRPPVPF